jgi:orotidine-5'-phosphate decarboxylase
MTDVTEGLRQRMAETTASTFHERLQRAVTARSPLCVGIDPSTSLLAQWELADDASGARTMGALCIESVAQWCAAVKFNIAFFERFGAAGLSALEALLSDARDAGLLTIADAKRGDIESTNAAYAQAWLTDGPLSVDAMTVSPYLGLDALEPYFEAAAADGRGVFVVVRSSNPEGRSIQKALLAGPGDAAAAAMSVEAGLLADIDRRPAGSVGAVIGVSAEPEPLALSPARFFLAPGVGAQGATARDLAALFWHVPMTSVLVNLSRPILKAGPDQHSLSVAAERGAGEISAGFCPPT